MPGTGRVRATRRGDAPTAIVAVRTHDTAATAAQRRNRPPQHARRSTPCRRLPTKSIGADDADTQTQQATNHYGPALTLGVDNQHLAATVGEIIRSSAARQCFGMMMRTQPEQEQPTERRKTAHTAQRTRISASKNHKLNGGNRPTANRRPTDDRDRKRDRRPPHAAAARGKPTMTTKKTKTLTSALKPEDRQYSARSTTHLTWGIS